MALARITITIPKDLLRAADARAKAENRPRSWVVAEALRGYLAGATSGSRVGESAPPAYRVGDVADARRLHLASEMRLSPTERLHRAEDLARLAQHSNRRKRGKRSQIIAFDSYEDFSEWKKARLAGA